MLDDYKKLFERDLDTLKKQISLYSDENDMWVVAPGISNSAGNLAMHLVGNLRHFIGHVIGPSDYKRQRDNEFKGRTSQSSLLEEIEITKHEVLDALEAIKGEDLDSEYPVQVFGHSMTTRFFLIHLIGHLNYHLGQINYHRRILIESNK